MMAEYSSGRGFNKTFEEFTQFQQAVKTGKMSLWVGKDYVVMPHKRYQALAQQAKYFEREKEIIELESMLFVAQHTETNLLFPNGEISELNIGGRPIDEKIEKWDKQLKKLKEQQVNREVKYLPRYNEKEFQELVKVYSPTLSKYDWDSENREWVLKEQHD
jgi:hypothetical protein